MTSKAFAKESRLFYIIFLGIITFSVLDILGIILLYQAIVWYDILLHGLSGVWIGFAAWVWLHCSHNELHSHRSADAFFILGVVALVGVLWEFFEFSIDTLVASVWDIPMLQGGTTDTMSDLFMDLLGGVGVIIFRFTHKRKA